MSRPSKLRYCAYCGVPLKYGRSHQGDPRQATKDHVIARCNGGTGTVRCCARCNADKNSLSLDEWRGALSIRYRRLHIFYFERRLSLFLIHRLCWRTSALLAAAGF